MELIIPDWDAPANIGALTTTRRGGFSIGAYDDGAGGGGLNLGVYAGDRPEDVRRNRDLLGRLLPAEPAWLSQVHGIVVVDAAQVVDAPRADASISTTRGVVCVAQSADCLPVLFCDVDGRVVGAAHAGWRGLAAGVLENTVTAMRNAGAGEILAWLGPAIGPEHFEVGEDVLAAFTAYAPVSAAAFKPISGIPGKYLADIYCLARQRLANVGIEHCYGGGLCTVSDRSRFYSYRRDRETGRMASLIWIK
jgi:YfiH family protein